MVFKDLRESILQLLKNFRGNNIETNPIPDNNRAFMLVADSKIKKVWYERRRKNKFFSFAAYLRAKRILDVAVCLALIPVALPILALCYLGIRIDSPGPVFFSQKRAGRGGKRFKLYKLRTMVKNAAELKEKYMHLNELKPPDFKITNDPRVTRMGWFLRNTSLDELPQIFNVLKGDMTLVGPRPSSYKAHTYDLWHTTRFELKPGITGLAQVCGRGELLLDEKSRYDISYLRNLSVWLDLEILLRTVGVVLTGKGIK